MSRKPKSRDKSRPRAKMNARIARANRRIQTLYWWRRQHVGEGWGVTVPTPHNIVDEIHNLALATPQQWEVVAIVYWRNKDGMEFHDFASQVTTQQFRAEGKGIVPFLEATLDAAKADMRKEYIYDQATIMRPYRKTNRHIGHVLRMLKDQLSLTEEDLEGWDAPYGEEDAG